MRWFLSASLVLHLLLALAFLRHSAPDRVPRPETLPEYLVVELSTPPLTPSKGTGVARGQSPGAGHKPSPFSFSAFAPVHKLNLNAARPGDPRSPEVADEFSPYQASENLVAPAGPQTGALHWVYRKAHLTLGYPSELAEHEIAGAVQARLVFDASGKYLPAETRVRAGSPYLKVYVYRTLERTFTGDAVPAPLVRWNGRLEVFCVVRFSLLENQAAVSLSSAREILGNKLYFERSSVRSKLEKLRWNLGPLHGIFPVPAVGVDMLWFARQAKQISHPTVPADDLAPYRADPLFYD